MAAKSGLVIDPTPAVACCFRGASKANTDRNAYPTVPGTDVSTEWLEGHLQEFVQSLCDEWGTALPLVQVWLPRKSTTGAATIFLSTEDCPYVIADPAMSAFRKRSTEMVYCKGQGLPGRVWVSGAAEVVQDHTFANPAHYTQRGLFLSQGITESIGIPVFVLSDLSTTTTAPAPAKGGAAEAPAAVIEVLLADGKARKKITTTDGRYLLHSGGSAALISSVSAHLESVGLALSPSHPTSTRTGDGVEGSATSFRAVPWRRVSHGSAAMAGSLPSPKMAPDTPPNSFGDPPHSVRSSSEFSSCVLVSAANYVSRGPSTRSNSNSTEDSSAAGEDSWHPMAHSFDTTTGVSFRGFLAQAGGAPFALPQHPPQQPPPPAAAQQEPQPVASCRLPGGIGGTWAGHVRLSADFPRAGENDSTLGISLLNGVPPRWQAKPFSLPPQRQMPRRGGSEGSARPPAPVLAPAGAAAGAAEAGGVVIPHRAVSDPPRLSLADDQ